MKSPRRAGKFIVIGDGCGYWLLMKKIGRLESCIASFANQYFLRRDVEAIVKRLEEKRK